ncbi:MAG TPA: carboxypeptidase regulatory-like domain-containing protein [Planctomycetes bacterium]|nr:carboxypeptidase regulatory-like domain-containing protein [Planctomycetota bacterium]HIL38285.1 carboxypeptidase regulatory-like domain-containing protein [Planctomycetota bacterium]
MKRLLPLMIAAIVLGLVYFLTSDLGGSGSEADGLDGSGDQQGLASSIGNGASATLQGGAGGGSSSSSSVAGTNGGGGGARMSSGVQLGDATAEGALEVFVLHPLGGNPIKGAQVRLLDRSALARGVWAKAQLSTSAKRDLMDVRGQVFQTSEQGKAVLPAVLNGVIHASGDGYEGWLEWVGPLASPHEISLMAAVDLRVLVVDSEGQPLPNSPVVLCINDPLNPRALDQTSSISPSGMANFRRVGATIGARNDETGFAVRLALPLVATELVRFDHKNLPREPLRLVMPAVGRLLVRVLDGEGEQVPRADITLGHFARDQKTGETVFKAEVFRRRAAGFARFENVPVGAEAVIKVSGTGAKRDLVQSISSPQGAGEDKEVTLVWDTTWPVIRARAVSGSGQPLTDRTGRAHLREDDVARGGAPITTDSKGYFDLPVTRAWTLGTHREVQLELFAQRGVPPSTARLDLSYEPREGVTEYGNVSFLGLPKLASGLVFADGRPVAGVQVRIMERVETKAGNEWVALGSMMATSRQDGTFEIYGEQVPSGPNVVMARRRGYKRAYSSEVHLPTGGLRLSLVVGEEEPTSIAGKGRARSGPDGQGSQNGTGRPATRPPGGFPVGSSSGAKGSPGKGGH